MDLIKHIVVSGEVVAQKGRVDCVGLRAFLFDFKSADELLKLSSNLLTNS
jgi:hypothetical protein